MAAIATRNCPYCKTQNVAFEAVKQWTTFSDERRSLFRCGSCGEGVIWDYFDERNVNLVQYSGNINTIGIILNRQWPETSKGDAPDDSPASAANFFSQATSSLEAGNFDAAGMMFRKVLEVSTRVLDPRLVKSNLASRIDTLVSAGALTEDMGKWAHQVRLGGNDAAHEDEAFTREQAEELRNFTENFLVYAFTLPTAVRRKTQPNTLNTT